MGINPLLFIAVAAVIAFLAAQSLGGRMALFAWLLALCVVEVIIWNVFASRRQSIR